MAIEDALRETLITPAVGDQEAANVVDALFAIARSVDHVAVALETLSRRLDR